MKHLSFLVLVLSSIALTPLQQASAQAACAELGDNIIYGVGGSAHAPLICQIGIKVTLQL